MKFGFVLLVLNAALAMALDLNINSIVGEVTSKVAEITSKAGDYAEKYSSALSGIKSELSNLETYTEYASITSAFGGVITGGPSALSTFIAGLPTNYDSAARSAISSALASAASEATSGAPVPTTTTGGGAGSNGVVAIWVVAAVGVFAAVLAL